MVIDTLKKPHPFSYNWVSILLPGIVGFLLILTIAPFGFDKVSFLVRLGFSLIFGVISSACVMLVVNLLRKLTPKFIEEENWTVGKEIFLVLLVIATIGLVNTLIFLVTGIAETPAWHLLGSVLLKTLAISIFPVSILVLFEQYSHQKKKHQEALAFTQQLKAQKLATPDKPQELPNREEEKIWLDAENGKPAIQLAYTDIAFLKSDGNYVEIYHSDSLSKRVVRNRLKYYAEKLPASDFFHCHKSYIINTHWVSEVRGNARNLELNISNSEFWIPVSRSKADAFYGFLKGREN